MYEVFLDLLNKKGVKVADVCKATGIRSSTMSDWKNGRYNLKQDKLLLIADYFGVDVNVFFSNQKEHYYDDETAHLAQQLFDDPDLHALLDAAKDSRPEYIKSATQLLKTLKETNPDG